MAQVVMAGRQELSKIQTIRSAAPGANAGDDSKNRSVQSGSAGSVTAAVDAGQRLIRWLASRISPITELGA